MLGIAVDALLIRMVMTVMIMTAAVMSSTTDITAILQ